jgi:hypothetical protein
MKLDFESILMRVVEHGWENRLELELVVDMIIEEDSVEFFSIRTDRLNDTEAMFEYTGELRNRLIARAVEIREEQKKNNPNGENLNGQEIY